MAKCVFIVQGEGRGHMSQSIALKEYLVGAGHQVEAVFVGTSNAASLPEYFKSAFQEKIRTFQSPYFLSSPNRKGILVGRTLVFNLLRSLSYYRESKRIRKEITQLNPATVFNFYDVVGALALIGLNNSIQRIGIGHHFLLHLNGYFGESSFRGHRFLLKVHTSLILKASDRVLALAFSEQEGNSAIEVVPPLIRRDYREMKYRQGDRYLVYLLKEGYLDELISMARKDPKFLADVFTQEIRQRELPSGIRMFPLSGHRFRELMAACKGLITTAGFDLAAEAAYHGIPLAVIPAGQHFEQKCNAIDIEKHGIGLPVNQLEPDILNRMKGSDSPGFRKWVDRSEELLLISLKE